MGLKSLKTVAEQTKNTAQNAVRAATAEVSRETSITGWANRLVAGAVHRRSNLRDSRDEGVYILSAEEVRRGRRLDEECFVAPDGYVRRSPVQEIVVAPDYYRRLVLRTLGYLVMGVAAAAVIYVLMKIGIMPSL